MREMRRQAEVRVTSKKEGDEGCRERGGNYLRRRDKMRQEEERKIKVSKVRRRGKRRGERI